MIFTATAPWLRFVLSRFPEVDLLTYVDADFRFFSSTEPLFEELGKESIAVVEHRYPPHLRHLEPFGRFNVGWLSFRRDSQGLACVEWWRERCIEWYFDRVEGDKFGDQKYLDRWPEMFDNLVILQHNGVNVAPWNVGTRRVHREGSELHIERDVLICFHFQGLKHVVGPLYESGMRAYQMKLDPFLRRNVFEPYLRELTHYEGELVRAKVTTGHARSQRQVQTGLRGLVQRATSLVTVARLLLSGSSLTSPRAGRFRT